MRSTHRAAHAQTASNSPFNTNSKPHTALYTNQPLVLFLLNSPHNPSCTRTHTTPLHIMVSTTFSCFSCWHEAKKETSGKAREPRTAARRRYTLPPRQFAGWPPLRDCASLDPVAIEPCRGWRTNKQGRLLLVLPQLATRRPPQTLNLQLHLSPAP